jgi:hypothetical protein
VEEKITDEDSSTPQKSSTFSPYGVKNISA